MPWSPTKEYRHPFACSSLGAGKWYGNKKSYTFVDEMVWLGTGSEVNAFRKVCCVHGIGPEGCGEEMK